MRFKGKFRKRRAEGEPWGIFRELMLKRGSEKY